MTRAPDHAAFQQPPARRPVRFPVVPFYGVIALLGISVAATVFGMATGMGTVRDTFGQPVAIRDIRLAVTTDDILIVTDAATREVIQTYQPGEGGFVRGSIRAFKRVRIGADPANAEPYRIIRWENGAVSLSDTATGQRYYLDAFGPDNAAAFAALLDTDHDNKTTADKTASTKGGN